MSVSGMSGSLLRAYAEHTIDARKDTRSLRDSHEEQALADAKSQVTLKDKANQDALQQKLFETIKAGAKAVNTTVKATESVGDTVEGMGRQSDLESAIQQGDIDALKAVKMDDTHTVGDALSDKEIKTLLEAPGAKVQKKLIYYGQQYWYRGRYGEVQKNQKVGVYLDIDNSKKNGLGMPLPKGIVRVYKADKSGAKQFIGEDSIDHTPVDEKVRIKMGDAFDVVGDRKQMSWRAYGSCTSESSWEIELRNHKKQAAQVEVFEPIGGDWTVLEESHPHHKKDAFTFTFDVKVPANGKTKISYRVRVRWC